MFSKIKKRASAVKFGFSLKIGSLAPWPSGDKACAVGWQRGKKRRGATEGRTPQQIPGQLGTAVHFNEVIHMSATLYMEGGAKAGPSGPFKKKCLILAIIETDPRTSKTESLGRVVLDLAEFASISTEVSREFPVACSKTIQAAVGEPSLSVTIRSSWKGAAGPGSGGSFASSLSSDATGGTLTSQLSSLVKNRAPEKAQIRGGMTGDQMDDLRAFDRLRTINESESEHRRLSSTQSEALVAPPPEKADGAASSVPSADRYDEDGIMVDSDDDAEKEVLSTSAGSVPNGSIQAATNPTPAKGSSRISSWLESSIDQEVGTMHDGNGNGNTISRHPSRPLSEGGTSSEHLKSPVVDSPVGFKRGESRISRPKINEDAGGTAKEGVPALSHDRRFARRSNPTQESTSQTTFEEKQSTETLVAPLAHEKGSSRVNDDNMLPVNGMNRHGGEVSKMPASRRWRRVTDEEDSLERGSAIPSPPTPEAQTFKPHQDDGLSRSQDSVPIDLDIQIQLRNAAFLEASVYLARTGRSQLRSRNAHAPARRIVRTLVALGPDNGCALLQDALKAITAMVEGCGADISGMAYWWSNCVQMRFLLPNVGSSGLRSSTPWKNNAAVTEISSTMRGIIDSILQLEKRIFDNVKQYLWWKLLIPKVADQGRTSRGSHGGCRGDGETATQRWLDALQSMQNMFLMSPSGNGTEGHVSLLRQQVLQSCCKQIDAMLFKELMAAHGGEQMLGDRFSDLVEDTSGVPSLDDCVLPFKRGLLTFGEGMKVKMAVTRWAEWAFEMDIRENQVGSKAGQNLFPLLKATADLLMMPKELLLDESVRQDAFAALSTRSICLLLHHFEPDDFAPDPLEPAVLKNLETNLQAHQDVSHKVVLDYEPPVCQEKKSPKFAEPSVSDDSLTFEFDEVSEDELDHMSSTYGGKEKPSRFGLLKELWVEKRERRRRGSR